AHASRLVADLGPAAVRIIAETFAELVTGQMRETRGPRPGDDLVEHYLTVIAEKTGSLIATSGRYGGMFSGCTPARSRTMPRWPRPWTCCASARASPGPRRFWPSTPRRPERSWRSFPTA